MAEIIDTWTRRDVPLTAMELYAVTGALWKAGWWYPPDAIQAVHEGRDSYHPHVPEIEYPMTPGIRKQIVDAMKAADVRQPPKAPEEYFRAGGR